MGDFTNMLNQSLATLSVPPRLMAQVQKVVIINTCSFMYNFVSDEVHLL
jgi:hypothetical protein